MSDTEGRCAHCPVAPGRHCQGTRVRRFCELTDPAHVAFNPQYRSLLDQWARGQPPPAPPNSAGGFDLAQTQALLDRLNRCPHRAPRTDCGCAGLAQCALGRGQQGLVNHHDCFDCLRQAGEIPLPTPRSHNTLHEVETP